MAVWGGVMGHLYPKKMPGKWASHKQVWRLRPLLLMEAAGAQKVVTPGQKYPPGKMIGEETYLVISTSAEGCPVCTSKLLEHQASKWSRVPAQISQ